VRSSELLVKVCGMKHPENIAAVAATGPDILGFIFYSGSKRAVHHIPDQLILPEKIQKAGVFVNEQIEVVREISRRNSLKWIQLHGDETPEYCLQVSDENSIVIKAIQVKDKYQLQLAYKYSGKVDMILLDTWGSERGGSGKSFDWSLLQFYDTNVPFLLSGGIGPDDAEKIIAMNHPLLAGIDINSRFEVEPGIKNAHLVEQFIQKIKYQPI
jgi:phosphoribosylanthranilate isomerase